MGVDLVQVAQHRGGGCAETPPPAQGRWQRGFNGKDAAGRAHPEGGHCTRGA